MIITKVALQNWRNFKAAEAVFRDVTYVVGPNASGKSNLLDVFRFLRDVAKPSGGGLQKAIADRGALKKLRCLHARTVTGVGLDIEVSSDQDAAQPVWRYELEFNSEGKGQQRPVVRKEKVSKLDQDGCWKVILDRPDANDESDPERLTQTAVEQIQANRDFRELADFFGKTTYVHLVPQLLKFSEQIGGRKLEDDPFGQGFMERLARTRDATRKNRLQRIERALHGVIPQLENLDFVWDEVSGLPHLEARFKHHRPRGAIQREDQFSDGTLRLISMFWLLLDGNTLLLLEEPELSLNEEIVAQLPYLIDQVQRGSRKKRQVILTTHSEAMLSNKGIDGRSIIRLIPSSEGTEMTMPSEEDLQAMAAGFSAAEVILPKARKVFAGGDRQLELVL